MAMERKPRDRQRILGYFLLTLGLVVVGVAVVLALGFLMGYMAAPWPRSSLRYWTIVTLLTPTALATSLVSAQSPFLARNLKAASFVAFIDFHLC